MRILGTKWQTLDPKYSEVATTLGVSRWQIFTKVTLPFLKSSLISALTIVFLFCATSFGVVLLLGGRTYQTLETTIYFQTNYQLNLQNAAGLTAVQILLIACLIAVSVVLPKNQGFSRGVHLIPSKIWQQVLGSIAVVAISVFPLIRLLISARIDWVQTVRNAFSVNKYLGISLIDAFGNSLIIAVFATVICVAACLAIVFAKFDWLNQLITVPLGISSVVLGYGLLIAFGTEFWIIPIAQSLVAIPIVVRTVAPILNSLDPKFSEISTVLQVGALRRFRKLIWPLVRLAVSVVCGLSLAISIGEFGATAFLVRPNTPTLPVAIYRLLSVPGSENFHLALLGAVILTFFTIGLVLITERRLTKFNLGPRDVRS
jgi:thiamine transport system permease protein